MQRRLALPALLAPLAAALLAAGPARAQAPAPEPTDAEVRKVDANGGKLTLRHGPIKHLDMPGMTMVFLVRDKALLAGVKAGDKVRVMVALEAGEYTVTALQLAP